MSRINTEGTHRTVRGELLVFMLGTVLAGCGGGGGGGSDPAPPPSPPPPPSSSELPPQGDPVSLNDNHRVGALHWEDGSTATGGNGQTVAGLDCLENMPEDYHVHTHLSIFLNGEALAVPANIGINSGPPRCFYTIHTHDHSGKLHIEAGAPGTYTLGQFFQVWGETLDATTVADLTGMDVVVYVTDDDGLVTKNTGNWSDIELKSHREITIQVGTEITEIPNFTWSAN